MWKLVITLSVLALLALLIWSPRDTTRPLITAPNFQTTQPSQNPYLIKNMAKRTYQSVIKTESQVSSTGKFSSYIVSFDSDGLKEYALMNVPRGKQPTGGWPVVVVNHGHIDPEIYSTANSYVNTSAYFANAGFLVLKPDYRGHDQSEGEAGSLVSRIEYAVDVLNLLAGIKSLRGADPSRVYMYGHSMGGDVTLRVLEVCPSCVRAASLWAPAVTDWPESFLYFTRRNADDPERAERALRFRKELASRFRPDEYSSVSTFANTHLVRVPVNLQQGTADESVPYAWGQALAQKLQDSGVAFQFYFYPGDNHDISGHWSTALNRDIALFNQTR